MQIHAERLASEVRKLPWHLPLAAWPKDLLVGLPRGLSRHVVRFVELGGDVLAVKETQDRIAAREHDMLQALTNLEVPAVAPLGHVVERRTAAGAQLPGALITVHLRYSLPYRALISQQLDIGVAERLVDALAALLARLHLAGFFWGDVSLSNALFRRDADSFAAYLVDAETGELHADLSDGQREHDLHLARTNIAGDFLDLQAGGKVASDVDPMAFSDQLLRRYRTLWQELREPEEFSIDERWRIDDRFRRLNAIGFDIGELTVTTDLDGVTTRIEPKVVEPGHHRRRLLRLTGIEAQENQARRMLNDLDSYRIATGRADDSEEKSAADWLRDVYRPVVEGIPGDFRDRLEEAQVFHEFLDHRWYLSERSGSDVSTPDAIRSYVENVLPQRPREASYLREPSTAALQVLSEHDLRDPDYWE
ncbi:DUF4032 domain-containing protein [Brevibacterium daeguense]|uniref:DUF4032 domain-containing protein n=1 Tax=Brevibacterium daeguense TaxID=909936 RepID=A0ABP8EGN5_9MICO|nr:DUF4032 domain-containing protein [Brevibacterium daeguense]